MKSIKMLGLGVQRVSFYFGIVFCVFFKLGQLVTELASFGASVASIGTTAGPEGARALAQALKGNTTLRRMDLRGVRRDWGGGPPK